MSPRLKFLGPAAIFVVLVGFLFVGLFRDPSRSRRRSSASRRPDLRSRACATRRR
jgi:hypothetical protein